jgi:phosphatidylinositol alpha 1,6-mannosyltransferase
MASGLPVVGVRAGGVQDLVQPEVTGLLAYPGDRKSFVLAARRLVADANLRRAIGTAARQQAEKYTWEAVFDDLMEYYAYLAGHRQDTLIQRPLASKRRVLV